MKVLDDRSGRSGVGGKHTTGALEEHGASRVVLSTAEENRVAQRLFARTGFRRTRVEMTRELEGYGS